MKPSGPLFGSVAAAGASVVLFRSFGEPIASRILDFVEGVLRQIVTALSGPPTHLSVALLILAFMLGGGGVVWLVKQAGRFEVTVKPRNTKSPSSSSGRRSTKVRLPARCEEPKPRPKPRPRPASKSAKAQAEATM